MTAAAVEGLSTEDLAGIREALAAGRRPKVMFTASAGQVAGQLGQVVQLADPAESEEFVVVRFGRDELPFSPADVAVAPKGAGRRAEAKPEPQAQPAAASEAEPEPEFVLDRKPVPAAREETKVSEVQSGSGTDKPARRGAKSAKTKGPAGLTITVAYADSEWTVAAQQGSKALAKPYVIKPAEAMKMVALIDVPGVHEAVEQILAAERAEAEQQAEKLRAELAEIESRLAELREAN